MFIGLNTAKLQNPFLKNWRYAAVPDDFRKSALFFTFP